jgi:hypothetical protein
MHCKTETSFCIYRYGAEDRSAFSTDSLNVDLLNQAESKSNNNLTG